MFEKFTETIYEKKELNKSIKYAVETTNTTRSDDYYFICTLIIVIYKKNYQQNKTDGKKKESIRRTYIDFI